MNISTCNSWTFHNRIVHRMTYLPLLHTGFRLQSTVKGEEEYGPRRVQTNAQASNTASQRQTAPLSNQTKQVCLGIIQSVSCDLRIIVK